MISLNSIYQYLTSLYTASVYWVINPPVVVIGDFLPCFCEKKACTESAYCFTIFDLGKNNFES